MAADHDPLSRRFCSANGEDLATKRARDLRGRTRGNDQRRRLAARRTSAPRVARDPSTLALYDPSSEPRATEHDPDDEGSSVIVVSEGAGGGALGGCGVVGGGLVVVAGGVVAGAASTGVAWITQRGAVSQIPSLHVPSAAQAPVTARPGPR
jgi:hypothetical protein